jgi:AbrB family looped-hinge helix DNA binding protein
MIAVIDIIVKDVIIKLSVMDSKVSQVRINENGRVVIPASFRRAMGIRSGDTVVLRLENDELRITTLRQRLAKAQRLVRKRVTGGSSLVDELIAERRQAARRE